MSLKRWIYFATFPTPFSLQKKKKKEQKKLRRCWVSSNSPLSLIVFARLSYIYISFFLKRLHRVDHNLLAQLIYICTIHEILCTIRNNTNMYNTAPWQKGSRWFCVGFVTKPKKKRFLLRMGYFFLRETHKKKRGGLRNISDKGRRCWGWLHILYICIYIWTYMAGWLVKNKK